MMFTKTDANLGPWRPVELPAMVRERNGCTPTPDELFDASLPLAPTDAPPGSPRKLAVLQERARRGEQLFHPEDAPPTTRNWTNAEGLLGQALAEGWTLREVAEALGCSRSFAYTRMKRFREQS